MLRHAPNEIPVVLHQHTPFVDYPLPIKLIERLNDRTVGRVNLSKADLTLCVSDPIESYVLELNPNATTDVLYNGVDAVRFHPREADQQLYECGQKVPVFFTLSRMSGKKGIDILLNAIENVSDSSTNAHFAIAGDGPMRSEVEEFSRDRTDVEVLGELKSERLPTYYATADVFLFTSLGGDAFPTLTMLEAYASGTAVIASKIDSDPPAIGDDAEGIFVEPGSVKDLTDAIITLATDPELVSSMGKRARATIERSFTIEDRINQLEWYYESLVDGRLTVE
jgi:glycosyltransferase involved in cell wall biosynthesis